MQTLLGLGADAGDGADRERREKVGLGAGGHENETVRLPSPRRDFCDQLRRGRADRCRQPDLGVDLKLDAPRHLLCVRRAVTRAGGDIEVGLIEADALDELG